MENITFKAKGMHCKSCEMIIEESLADLQGVHTSKADHKTGTIKVSFDKTKVTPNKIRSIIEKEGYKVE